MTELLSSTPADRLKSRLDDPEVAAALNTLLDHADVLALAAVSVGGFLERSDTIMSNLSGGISELRSVGGSAAFLAEPTKRLAEEAPAIADAATALLDSGMLNKDVVDLLGRLAQALLVGAEAAKANGTSVNGLFPALRALKDPDVGRGLGFLIEVSRALGKSL
jgi:uncharacterized protein YjgD (DUF1641 family)